MRFSNFFVISSLAALLVACGGGNSSLKDVSIPFVSEAQAQTSTGDNMTGLIWALWIVTVPSQYSLPHPEIASYHYTEAGCNTARLAVENLVGGPGALLAQCIKADYIK